MSDNQFLDMEMDEFIETAVGFNKPFVAIAEPGSARPVLWVEDEHGSMEVAMAPFDYTRHDTVSFKVSPFDSGRPIGRGPAIPASEEWPVQAAETDRDGYLAGVTRVIDILKKSPDDNKTVIAKATTVTSRRPLWHVCSRYFDSFPDTFRYLWFHPETGLWMGATPELLLDYRDPEHLKSMSVAGTRPSDCPGAWDGKNRREHDIVTSFIESVFDNFCRRSETGADCNLQFGDICHLCTPVTGHHPLVDVDLILDTLSPTPAVCGYPRKRAMDAIRETETFDRWYYAGYIKFNGRAWVNLRCASVRPVEDGCLAYTVFSGGGITSSSNPIAEWDEACRKGSFLIEAISAEECHPSDGTSTVFESTIFNQ